MPRLCGRWSAPLHPTEGVHGQIGRGCTERRYHLPGRPVREMQVSPNHRAAADQRLGCECKAGSAYPAAGRLKVPPKQSKRGRLWLNGRPCIRLQPCWPIHVRSDLLPFGPSFIMRVLVVHSASTGSMVAGDRRSWSGLRSWSPADRLCAASGVRPPWAECGRTWL